MAGPGKEASSACPHRPDLPGATWPLLCPWSSHLAPASARSWSPQLEVLPFSMAFSCLAAWFPPPTSPQLSHLPPSSALPSREVKSTQLPRRFTGSCVEGQRWAEGLRAPRPGWKLSTVGKRVRCTALILTEFASPAFLMAPTQWSALCPPADNA